MDISDNVDISKLTVGKRVTLLSDSYKLEKMLQKILNDEEELNRLRGEVGLPEPVDTPGGK